MQGLTLGRALESCNKDNIQIVHQAVKLGQSFALDGQQGSITPRQRLAASRALAYLLAAAQDNRQIVVAAMTLEEAAAARAVLVHVHSMAVRNIAEAGGAAHAAASRTQPDCESGSTEYPKATSAAAWVEVLQQSSELLHIVLHSREKLDPSPDSNPPLNPESTAAPLLRIRHISGELLAALLRLDALSALSRLLAAEVHRGTAAVLDTDIVMSALQPLCRVVGIAYNCQLDPVRLGPAQRGQKQPQPQLLGAAVLRALAGSGVVEHVCRFALTRLAGQQAGGATGGLPAEERSKHWASVVGLVQHASELAREALARGRGDAADAWAVMLSPCLQYLVQLYIVSQLHALDGGATYGLPYDKLMAAVPVSGGAAARGPGPVVLDGEGLMLAYTTWRMRFLMARSSSCGAPPLVRPRMVLQVLLRVASAAVRSWEHSRSSSSGRSSSSTRGSSQRAAPVAVLDAAICPDLAVFVLWLVKVITTLHPAPSSGGARQGPQGRAVGAGAPDCGEGSGAGGAQTLANCEHGCIPSGSGCGASDSAGIVSPAAGPLTNAGGCDGRGEAGAPSVAMAGVHEDRGCGGNSGGGDQAERSWRSWAARRRFGDTWWRLVVAAVHAQLDDEAGERRGANVALTLMQAILDLEKSGTGEGPATGGAASAPSTSAPQPLPAPWLSAAVSAGYLPCLERFMRTMASPACSYPAAPEQRAAAVIRLLDKVYLLAVYGEEQEAAALVVTAVKAMAGLAGGDVCRQAALCRFADIPGALCDAALDAAAGSGSGQRQQQQRKLLRLVSLCLARWLPLCAALLRRARAEAGAGVGAEAGSWAGAPLGTGRYMVRLAGLARGAAEGRGDARAAESWGRLLAACGGIAAAEGEQGQRPGVEDVDADSTQLAPLLPPPCDVVKAVLPWCSNPLCTSLEGHSEAGLQLVWCRGRCGGAGCGGVGPCCCGPCARGKVEWMLPVLGWNLPSRAVKGGKRLANGCGYFMLSAVLSRQEPKELCLHVGYSAALQCAWRGHGS